MHRPLVTWSASLGALVAYDVWCSWNETAGDSLSEVLREVFRVGTPAGRVVVVGGWAVLAAWFLPHLTRLPAEVARSVHGDREDGSWLTT